MKRLNLNELIKVKLTDKGYQHLADEHNNFWQNVDARVKVPHSERHHTAQEYKRRVDTDGYYQMQLWELIDKFGGLGMGLSSYIELTILIKDDAIT